MRRQLPPWAMGLAVSPLGFYFGFVSTAMPILLAAKGVPVGKIAEVSAIGFSPSFWAFLLCPLLDVRFNKRTYALFFAGVAAMCLGVSTLLTANLGAFTVVVLVRTLTSTSAAILLALTVMAPTAMLFFIPLPAKAMRSVEEMVASFFGDLYRVCKRPGCILGLICFVSPTACFALTNLFSGMGADFHTPESWVTALNGPGVAVVCSLGCLAGIWICGRFLRRTVYVVAGFGGASAALALIWMPHTLAFFAAGVLVYNFFQGINYTALTALEFEIVGPGNPLASTQIALLTASSNLPISYMTAIDGHFHTTHGLSGMLAVDGISSVVVGTTLLLAFRWRGIRRTRGPEREVWLAGGE